MKDINWKRLGRKLLFLPGWLMIVLTLLSAAVLAVVFVKGWETHPAASATYVLAFYTLTVDCIFCSLTFPRWYRAAKKKICDTKYGGRYMTDVTFKTHVSLYLSLGVNILYAAMNALSGWYYHTAWFGILAAYYILLAVMRFLLLRFVNKNGIGRDRVPEYRRSRLCGILLLFINLTLSGAVLMILYQNRGYEYHGILIYVMAAYTFYTTIHAIVSILKYRKYKSPVMSSAKIISLSSALVSMLALETAMISQFGADNSPEFRQIMVALTGAGVSIVVVTMSVYMIVRATKEIRRLQDKQS